MITALSVILTFAAYGFVGGVAYRLAHPAGSRYNPGDSFDPHVCAVFWPVYLPARAAIWLADQLSPATRGRGRRERQLAEAQHRVDLARLVAQEAAAVDRALQAARNGEPKRMPQREVEFGRWE